MLQIVQYEYNRTLDAALNKLTMAFDSQRQRHSVCISPRKEVSIYIYSFFWTNVRFRLWRRPHFWGLSWTGSYPLFPHLKYVTKKALKALNMLKVIGNTEWGAIRSNLDYGCIVYGSYLQILDPIHNQGLRLCLGAFRTSPVESL